MYITGKGRCNFTNDVPPEEFINNVVNNPKFLLSSIYAFPPERCIRFFEEGGMPAKVERGNRAFPVSDKASDVTRCLEKYCKSVGVKFKFNTEITKIHNINSTMFDIVSQNESFTADKVIICTGGISYPSTGSTGDGYKFAQAAGHKIIQPKPALCGLNLAGNFYKEMQGLSLKNINLSVYRGSKLIASQFGELLFTHFGISGPTVLTVSSLINRLNLRELKLSLDFKPALSEEQLDNR
ncbi:MAG: aminoacetone oxidase family FAD-binding enzyme, partial [Candidatus Coproplasma sp.]